MFNIVDHRIQSHSAFWGFSVTTHTSQNKVNAVCLFFLNVKFFLSGTCLALQMQFSRKCADSCQIFDIILIYHWSGPHKSEMTSVHRRSLGRFEGNLSWMPLVGRLHRLQSCPYSFRAQTESIQRLAPLWAKCLAGVKGIPQVVINLELLTPAGMTSLWMWGSGYYKGLNWL